MSLQTPTAEERAVMAVISAESESFFNKDLATFSRCWMHSPFVRRLGWWTRGGVSDVVGWDELFVRTREMMLDLPEPNRTAQELTRENVVLRVAGDMAWATFDQYSPDTGEPDIDMPGLSRECRVLEKHAGEWRIVYHTYIHQTVEPVRSPMFRVDGNADVSWMNHAAEQALKRDTLTMIQGRLAAKVSSDTKKLRAAILDASQRDSRMDGGRVAIPIILDPLDSEEICVCWVLTEGAGSGAVLVSINNLTFAQDHLAAAATVFGLSPSQQRLAELIISGRDVAKSATSLGISVNTARTHLQRMFDKTGVHSQPALVRTLLSVAQPA